MQALPGGLPVRRVALPGVQLLVPQERAEPRVRPRDRRPGQAAPAVAHAQERRELLARQRVRDRRVREARVKEEQAGRLDRSSLVHKEEGGALRIMHSEAMFQK